MSYLFLFIQLSMPHFSLLVYNFGLTSGYVTISKELERYIKLSYVSFESQMIGKSVIEG